MDLWISRYVFMVQLMDVWIIRYVLMVHLMDAWISRYVFVVHLMDAWIRRPVSMVYFIQKVSPWMIMDRRRTDDVYSLLFVLIALNSYVAFLSLLRL